MAVAYRSSANVTNGTAGTSVTVSKPASTANDDQLIAFIAATGAPSMTPPAGWTLVKTLADPTSAVTLWCYRKTAASEGASWTWTLGTAQRNWGQVGAYTGVDTTRPVVDYATDNSLTSSTTLAPATPNETFSQGYGAGVHGYAAVRTASGVATTWVGTYTERLDTSTNAGAGNDIAGLVESIERTTSYPITYTPSGIASQTQTAGVAIALSLRPSLNYTGGLLTSKVLVEAAFGADPDGDQSLWSWTDITSKVMHDPGIAIAAGRPNATSTADPTRITLTVKNISGEWTSPSGAYTEHLVRNLPIRVKLTGLGSGGADSYHRGTAFLAEARPRWDTSTNVSVVDLALQGALWRLQRDAETKPLHSAGYRAMIGIGLNAVAPVAYWSFEDGSDAASAAAAVDGVAPAAVAGVTFAGNSSLFVGSDALATFTATSAVSAPVPAYPASDHWAVMWAESITTEPGAQTVLAFITTTGTARRWRVSITPGTTALVLDVYDGSGASLLSTNVAITEADFYGRPRVFGLMATKNGSGIDYELWCLTGNSGTGLTGTLASQTAGNVTLFQTVFDAGVNGASFGHVGVYSDSSFDVGGAQGLDIADAIITGNAGELPWERFQRLCVEEGVNYNVSQSENLDLAMGSQPIDTFVNILRECEVVENVSMHDAGTFVDSESGLLFFPARDDRDNADAVLTLDMNSSQVVGGFEPSLDDQNIVNDVQLVRDGGSSARRTDEDSIDAEGRYQRQYTVNTEDDTFLQHMASQRVNEGTTGHEIAGMRFPTVGWNLRNPNTYSLAVDWLNCRIGSKLSITNPPSQYPPDTISAFIEGYTETITSDRWEVLANLSPADPNGVFVLAQTTSDAHDWLGRLAEDDAAAIRTAINTSTTSIDIDPNAMRWTTVADDFDPDPVVRIGNTARVKETATCSAIATTAATFVAAGAASHADNAAVTPALYAGSAANDLILIFAAIRSSGTGTLATPTGYSRLPVWSASDNVQLFAKVHSGSESNPTVTPSGGAAGDSVSAVTFGLRNMPITLTDLADIVVRSEILLNASAQNITYPEMGNPKVRGCVVLALGWKQDDWTSVATLSGFTEAVDVSTTTGNDQGLVVDYVIQTTKQPILTNSFTVTGGATAISRAAVVALAGGYQTLTVARSYNGVTKSHTAGTRIGLDHPYVLGM